MKIEKFQSSTLQIPSKRRRFSATLHSVWLHKTKFLVWTAGVSYEHRTQTPEYATASVSSPLAGFCISGAESSGSATRQSKQHLWCNWILLFVDTATRDNFNICGHRNTR